MLLLLIPIQIGWIGTKVAFIRDARVKGKVVWRKLPSYLWKYFKRLLPLILVLIVIGIVVFIVGGIILIYHYYNTSGSLELPSPERTSEVVKSFVQTMYEFVNSPKFFFLSLPLLVLNPFFYAFIPVVVLEDISAFRGIPQTIVFLRKNIKLYLALLVYAFIINALFSVPYVFFGAPAPPYGFDISARSGVYSIFLRVMNEYLSLLVASFIVVYYLEGKKRNKKILYKSD